MKSGRKEQAERESKCEVNRRRIFCSSYAFHKMYAKGGGSGASEQKKEEVDTAVCVCMCG